MIELPWITKTTTTWLTTLLSKTLPRWLTWDKVGDIMGLLKKIYLFIFREWGMEGEREGEKHQCVVASHAPPTGDLTRNPGMCPDQELNQRPFGSQAGAQSTEPHQLGLGLHKFNKNALSLSYLTSSPNERCRRWLKRKEKGQSRSYWNGTH